MDVSTCDLCISTYKVWTDLCHSYFSFVYFFASLRLFFLPRCKVHFVPHVGKKQNVAAVKRLLVHHHSADSIFWSFRIIGLILSQFGNRVPLKPVLGGVGSVAPLHYCTWTASIKPSLVFLFLWCVWILIQNLFYLYCSWCCAMWRP